LRYIVKIALLCRFLQNGGSPPSCFVQIGGLPLYTAERYSNIIIITNGVRNDTMTACNRIYSERGADYEYAALCFAGQKNNKTNTSV
jgi:hypothetical protein